MSIDSANIQIKKYSWGMDSLFPSRLDENISSDAPVRLVNRIVDELDISPLLSTYKGGACPAYYPRMLLKVLFFAYLNNVYSYRKIAVFFRRTSFTCGFRASPLPTPVPSMISVASV